MTTELKISFVIPVYNAAEYLPRLLASLEGQAYGNWEALFTDDGSNDGSVDILKKAEQKDGRIRVFEIAHEGSSGARNKGLDNVTGDVVGFIDADDFIHPQLLETVMPHFADSTTDAVMFDFMPVEVDFAPPFEEIAQSPAGTIISDPVRWALTPWKPTAHGVWRTFYRREVIGKLRFYPKIKHQDLLFSYQAWGAIRKMVKLDSVLYAYVQTPGSVIRSAYGADRVEANFIIMRELYRFYAGRPEIIGLLKGKLFSRRIKEVWKQVDRAESLGEGPLHALLFQNLRCAWRDDIIGVKGLSPWKALRLLSVVLCRKATDA